MSNSTSLFEDKRLCSIFELNPQKVGQFKINDKKVTDKNLVLMLKVKS